jgi:uncharacterized RDD family membrane protein YckC
MDEYAGFVTRAIAFVVDAAIVNAVAIVVAAAVALGVSVLPGSHHLHGLGVVLAGAAFVLWCIAYWAAFWATTGQTPGDRVMHVRVQRLDGSILHAFMAIVRVVATALAALPLLAGFIPILLTTRRRGLQDWVAGTVVVYTDTEPSTTTTRAGPVGARRLDRELGPDAVRGPFDDGTHDAENVAAETPQGLGDHQNGDRPADVDVDLHLRATLRDENTGIQPGDVLGEGRPQ